jgi:ABC-type phosphate transport system substrate-binding protein
MRFRAVICVALIAVAGAVMPAPAEPAAEFRVIVNRDNPIAAIDRALLADFYLKRITRWTDDRLVQPVDRDASAAVRERFSEEVLRRPPMAVKSYWQQLIFSGRALPPPEFSDDELVIAYVASHPGGVGYVSATTPARGVKTIEVR